MKNYQNIRATFVRKFVTEKLKNRPIRSHCQTGTKNSGGFQTLRVTLGFENDFNDKFTHTGFAFTNFHLNQCAGRPLRPLNVNWSLFVTWQILQVANHLNDIRLKWTTIELCWSHCDARVSRKKLSQSDYEIQPGCNWMLILDKLGWYNWHAFVRITPHYSVLILLRNISFWKGYQNKF